MSAVTRSIPGLRDAMFDVLDKLRSGAISHAAARAQIETAKTVCLTVVSEYRELQVLQKQIEIDNQFQQLGHDSTVIDHET